MTRKARRSSLVPQNLGWLDRLIRVIIGTALIASAVTFLTLSPETPTWLSDGSPMSWPYYAILIAIYPLLTAILGRDPIYALMGIRSCGTSQRNPCGTFPFEVDAAVGNTPRPRDDIEHSLSNSRFADSHEPSR